MGAILAARAGFEERELVQVKRCRMRGESDEPNVGDVTVDLWVAIRQPSDSLAEKATSSGSPALAERATSLGSPALAERASSLDSQL